MTDFSEGVKRGISLINKFKLESKDQSEWLTLCKIELVLEAMLPAEIEKAKPFQEDMGIKPPSKSVEPEIVRVYEKWKDYNKAPADEGFDFNMFYEMWDAIESHAKGVRSEDRYKAMWEEFQGTISNNKHLFEIMSSIEAKHGGK